tara:strand:- start:823 stop:1032 length:210 start_codon:yes stop_codon:yes gene_type:complete
MMTGYLEKDDCIIKYLDEYKKKNTVQGKAKRLQVARNISKGKETEKQFALNENEIEDIFDIIAEEFPEL